MGIQKGSAQRTGNQRRLPRGGGTQASKMMIRSDDLKARRQALWEEGETLRSRTFCVSGNTVQNTV